MVQELREYLAPPRLAPPPEPYHHAIRCGDFLIMSGQVAFDEHNNIVGINDPEAQVRQIWSNIRACVEAAGGTIDDVVRVAYYLADINVIQAEMRVRREMFPGGNFPCATCVQVARLGLDDLLLEVEATAYIPRKDR